MERGMAYISIEDLMTLKEDACDADYLGDKAEELENQVLELKAKLDEWALVDMWWLANPYYKKCFEEWKAKQGLDDNVAEIERLQGINTELARAVDELTEQVAYWREKAGVDNE